MGRVKVDGLPDNMSVINHGSSIELIRNWHTRALLSNTLLLIALMTMAVIYLIVFSDTLMQKVLRSVVAMVILAMPLIIMWKNKTHILVQRGQVSVKHKPFPYFGNRTIPSHSIKQVYVKQHSSSAPEDDSLNCAQLKYFHYEIIIILKKNKELSLLKGLKDHQHALFIEEEIEKFLNIEDQQNNREFGSKPILGW